MNIRIIYIHKYHNKKNMNVNFLSLDPSDIPHTKIINEIIPSVSVYLLDIRKQIIDPTLDPAVRSTILMKFKIIVDLVEIYKDPGLLKLIKDYQLEKERETQRQLFAMELEKKRKEQKNNQNNNSSNDTIFGNLLGNSENETTIDIGSFNRTADTSDDDINSELSEEDLQQTEVSEMLDSAYDGISKNSTLRKNINVTRRYMCYLQEEDSPNQNNQSSTSNTSNQLDSVGTEVLNNTNIINIEGQKS
jgi:hypothetical protein